MRTIFIIPHPSALIPKLWSGRRDLNSRLRPWQGRALPLSYSRLQMIILRTDKNLSSLNPNLVGGSSDVFDKTPIAARTDFDIADAFVSDDHIRRIPERKHRHVVADNFLGFEI